jgi:DNA-directed RNA polymerase subunit RPC12/RpoP
MADKLDEIEDKQENLEMYIGILDNDLQDVEENFYGYEDSEEYIVEDDFIEYQCPRCGEKIYIDKSIVENKEMINCPNCSFNLMYDGIQGMND